MLIGNTVTIRRFRDERPLRGTCPPPAGRLRSGKRAPRRPIPRPIKAPGPQQRECPRRPGDPRQLPSPTGVEARLWRGGLYTEWPGGRAADPAERTELYVETDLPTRALSGFACNAADARGVPGNREIARARPAELGGTEKRSFPEALRSAPKRDAGTSGKELAQAAPLRRTAPPRVQPGCARRGTRQGARTTT